MQGEGAGSTGSPDHTGSAGPEPPSLRIYVLGQDNNSPESNAVAPPLTEREWEGIKHGTEAAYIRGLGTAFNKQSVKAGSVASWPATYFESL